MKKFIASKNVPFDLKEIFDFIAPHNKQAARKTVDDIYKKFHDIADNKYIGHKREDLTDKDYRFLSVYSYMIIYDPNTSPVTILRVISGYRNTSKVI